MQTLKKAGFDPSVRIFLTQFQEAASACGFSCVVYRDLTEESALFHIMGSTPPHPQWGCVMFTATLREDASYSVDLLFQHKSLPGYTVPLPLHLGSEHLQQRLVSEWQQYTQGIPQ